MYDQRDNRGPPQATRAPRGRSPQGSYGPRGRSPQRTYETRGRSPPYNYGNYGNGQRENWRPPQREYRSYDQNPVPLYNYYAPLRDYNDDGRVQNDHPNTYQNGAFLERGMENHPPKYPVESRGQRNSPGRREGREPGGEHRPRRN